MSNNFKNHQEEPCLAPLLQPSKDHMAQSVNSGDLRDIVLKIDGNSNHGFIGDNKIAGSSNYLRVSTKESDEPVQQTGQWTLNSGGEDVPARKSNDSLRKYALLMKATTKSRLMDPLSGQDWRLERLLRRSIRKDNDHDEDDKLFNGDIPEELKKMNFSTLTIIQLVFLVLIVAALVCSLSIPVIRRQRLCDLHLWKWEVMILVLICGRLVSDWGIRVMVFLLEPNFLFRKRVLYFIYGLRNAVRRCLWLSMVLIAWDCIFFHTVKEKTKSKILPYVTKGLVCLLVGNFIWLVKTLLVKIFASGFHVSTFFDRIHDALFAQYVIETISNEPLYEEPNIPEQERAIKRATSLPTRTVRVLESDQEDKKRPKSSMSRRQDERIPIDHLHKLTKKNISARNMKRLINTIRHGSLTTLDERILNSDSEDTSSMQIRTECQAKEAAKRIFQNVAKLDSECITLEDLMLFMEEEEAFQTMHLIGATECKGISKASLENWVVHAFEERKALSLSLNDTKTAVDELHIILNIIVFIIIVIIWLIILGVSISHFLLLLSSQLLLAVFIFGNTCKTAFEAIIFLFIMHPYDVGDRCEVDGVQMIVDEMNILTTVFLRYDNQKIIYPNSVLASKPISNYHRSPDMWDSIDFCIHISTPPKKSAIMKDKIKEYIARRSDHWQPDSIIVTVDIHDMNKLKIRLSVHHRMNFQNIGERWARRELLVEAMIEVFRELEIEYRMLPHDVNVRNMPALVSDQLPSNWTTCAY